MMNSLFSQFSPQTILAMPMKIISSILALGWLTLVFPSNFMPTQVNSMVKLMETNASRLLFKSPKTPSSPWTTPLLTIFFLVLMINIVGLLPYAFTITSHISFTYSMAIPLWLSINILGFYQAFNSRLSHLIPQGTPWYLIPLMVWIETISLVAQPIALGLRLAAKLTAGHLLIFLLSTSTWVLSKHFTLSFLSFIMLTLLFVLEMAVACMQAYVFTSLINFYLDQKK